MNEKLTKFIELCLVDGVIMDNKLKKDLHNLTSKYSNVKLNDEDSILSIFGTANLFFSKLCNCVELNFKTNTFLIRHVFMQDMITSDYYDIFKFLDLKWEKIHWQDRRSKYEIGNYILNSKKIGAYGGDSLGFGSSKKFNNDVLPVILEIQKHLLPEYISRIEDRHKLYEIEQKEIEKQRLNELQISQNNVLSELDKDGNGEVDVVEGNEFNLLLKKYQKDIIEIDRNYVQQFVKVSSYLKTKKGNIQSIFNTIKDTPHQKILKEYVEILKDEIHTYNQVLFNSLNMIVLLVKDDMVTFYEIHEMFDTLNMFDSKHEKDVSQKLSNIGDGLKDLMYEIRSMSDEISNSIQELSYVTEESNREISYQLSEIDSSINVGNLINTINAYQNYKNNRKRN
jgi:hypothetical protein